MDFKAPFPGGRDRLPLTCTSTTMHLGLKDADASGFQGICFGLLDVNKVLINVT